MRLKLAVITADKTAAVFRATQQQLGAADGTHIMPHRQPYRRLLPRPPRFDIRLAPFSAPPVEPDDVVPFFLRLPIGMSILLDLNQYHRRIQSIALLDALQI